MKKKVAIVIPIYKSIINESELISLIQCITILRKYPILFCTHQNLNIENYISIISKHEIRYEFIFFDESYFKDLNSYNGLLKSTCFYKKFNIYKYILIYQLDAFVFRDDLLYWCNKGYDYIGAPWFTGHKPYVNGGALMAVGNGGFSLRKISTFIKILNWKLPIDKPLTIMYRYKVLFKKHKLKNFILCFFDILAEIFGYKNNIVYKKLHSGQEDGFWSYTFSKEAWIQLKKPSIEEASQFAFEMSPQYLFELNNKKLPFGCHAWLKYEYETFWKNFIF